MAEAGGGDEVLGDRAVDEGNEDEGSEERVERGGEGRGERPGALAGHAREAAAGGEHPPVRTEEGGAADGVATQPFVLAAEEEEQESGVVSLGDEGEAGRRLIVSKGEGGHFERTEVNQID